MKLAQKLRDFAYDPSRSFRGWLKTVAHHAWRDFVDRPRRAQAAAGDSQVRELLQTLEAREDLHREAGGGLRPRTAGSGQGAGPPAGGAAHLGGVPPGGARGPAGRRGGRQRCDMQVAMVYVAKSKVQKMLQEEIRKLDEARVTRRPAETLSCTRPSTRECYLADDSTRRRNPPPMVHRHAPGSAATVLSTAAIDAGLPDAAGSPGAAR